MSLWRDELKATPSTIASLIALGLVAVVSMSRLISWPGYAPWALAALAIGATFAAAFGQRSLGLGFGLLVVFAAVTLPALFLKGDDAALLPSPEALSNARELIAAGLSAIPKVTPPVPAEPKFVVLVWLSLLLLGFLSAAWVVVRRPVGAVISTIAVVTFTGSVGDGAGRTWFALASVAITGVFFLTEGRDRIARWGAGRIPIPGWLGLPTLATACVIAVLAPIVLGDQPIVRLQSAIRPRVVIIKPLSDIKRQLKVDPPLEVMRVVAVRPEYWRLTGLDSYDGREWVLEARPKDVRDDVVPEADPPTTGADLEQTYRLTSLLAPWLPAVYSAVSVHSDARVQVDAGSQTLLLAEGTSPGLVYTVRSRLPKVAANFPATPREVSDATEKLFGDKARPIVAGAETPLDFARRLEAHFRSYDYDEDVAGGHTVERLDRFLVDKRGYCEQFAATMTLMLRGLGIEARVGVGFLPGTQSAGEFVVSTRDAHAWVEANIPGAGWFSFDPTPGRSDASSIPPEAEEQQSEPGAIPQATTVPAPTPATDELPSEVTEQPAGRRIPAAAGWSALFVALALAPATGKTIRRRRRRTRGTPDDAVVGAYTDLLDGASDLGWRARLTETQREFVDRVLGAEPSASRLAISTARALYGPGRSSAQDAKQAWTDRASARRALSKKSPAWRRALAFFDPRTFVPPGSLPGLLRRARTRVASAIARA